MNRDLATDEHRFTQMQNFRVRTGSDSFDLWGLRALKSVAKNVLAAGRDELASFSSRILLICGWGGTGSSILLRAAFFQDRPQFPAIERFCEIPIESGNFPALPVEFRGMRR